MPIRAPANTETLKRSSDKLVVIERLFFDHWDPATSSLRRTTFTQDDVVLAIQRCNQADGKKRSVGNPANFMKDIVRKAHASEMWPAALTALRYTARQRTGDRSVFEFVPFKAGQSEPFPDTYKYRNGMREHGMQSLSMLLESKVLGRRDESWITQTAVKLGVVEAHFALESPHKKSILDVIHLQMSMKLRKTEMDAIYMARFNDGKGGAVRGAITCEAKQHDERILENQLVEQARAAFEQGQFALVIPIGLRAVKGQGIYIAEFEQVDRNNVDQYEEPVLVSEGFYSLNPRVPGI